MAINGAVLKAFLAPGFLFGVGVKGDYLCGELLKLTERFGLAGERGEGLLRALKLGRAIGPADRGTCARHGAGGLAAQFAKAGFAAIYAGAECEHRGD